MTRRGPRARRRLLFCTALNARKRIVDWRAHEALNARVAAMLRAGGGCDQRPGVGGWDPLYGLSYPFRASLFRAVAAEIAEAKEAEAVRVAAALPPSPRAAWHAVRPPARRHSGCASGSSLPTSAST